MNFKEELKRRTEEAEHVIREYLPEESGFAKTMAEAMNYSMTAGGKRLRPILIRETYELFGGKDKLCEPFMAAMEMIHTHSLIHDDLPALDNDDYRRGRLTTHKVYGEAMGVLSGVALLNRAYEVMLSAFDLTEDKDRVIAAMRIIADKTGINGMLGGQSVDVENDGKPLEHKMLDYIYKNKTSALIEASMMTGAVLAGASEKELKVVEQAAENIGLAFQIQDDILDVTSTQEELGKPIHSDEKNNKVTYVSLMGAPAAAGKVTGVYEDREIGKAVTMDLGNGYEVTYGQLDNILVSEGSYVAKGDVIAQVASPTKYYSVEGTNVYFKLTKDGVPVNPMSKLK